MSSNYAGTYEEKSTFFALTGKEFKAFERQPFADFINMLDQLLMGNYLTGRGPASTYAQMNAESSGMINWQQSG
jgi:hypothetical protein